MPIKLDSSVTDIEKLRKFWKEQENEGKIHKPGSFNKNVFFNTPRDGEYEVRILAMMSFQSGAHWNIVEGREGKKGPPVRCPRIYENSRCPICEYIDSICRTKDSKKIDEVKKLMARPRYPMIVVDMDDAREKGFATPLIYEAPSTVYFPILNSSKTSRFDYGNFMDVEDGRSILITRGKNKKNDFTEYSVIFSPEKSALEYEIGDIPDIEKILSPRSEEDIAYALENGEFPSSEDKDDSDKKEEKKATRYSKGLPGPKTRDEEPEDDDEVEEEQEFVTEKKQVRKKKAVAEPKKRASGISDDLRKKLDALKRK